MIRILIFTVLSLFFIACSNHSSDNLIYTNALLANSCSNSFLDKEQEKVENKKDVIYVGLNAAYIARQCDDFNRSNYLFDKVEDSYKYDVDLKSAGSKALKTVGTTLINDNISDYDGTLYERIMLNVYKGLNFMSLNDFENARVEFNRALNRQDRAKEYFASDIAALRAEFDKNKKDENYGQINSGFNDISKQYEHLLKDFQTTKNFVNPYATYMSALFFFLDDDYIKAADLFKEVAVVNSKKAELNAQLRVFNQYANSSSPQRLKKYIFVVYENGLGAGLEEFKFSIPYVFNDNIVNTSFALPVLKTRSYSYPYLLANDKKSVELVNFDNIIATEFKIKLPLKILKAVSSSISKTAINMAVANNDSTGGLLSLATSVLNAVTTNADLRYWSALPKSAQVVMLENKGSISIEQNTGKILYTNENLDKNKNALLVLRSFSENSPSKVWLIQK